MPTKRTALDDPNGGLPKHVKTEQPEEFSNAVKKKLQSSSRTGQACDRCKVRKIRCDGLPGGCSPCLQNQTECKTTDRITGRAAPRGYVEGLEAQNRSMEQRIRELEHRLMQSGIDIRSPNAYHDTSALNYGYGQPSATPQTHTWNSNSPSYPPQPPSNLATQQQETNMFRTIPASFRAGFTGDNYLGINPGNSTLSSIKGTALSILGMEIDIADFDSLDMDEPDSSVFHPQLYNKSYQSFLQTALNINPRIEKVDLPTKEDGMTYVQWYFRVLNPYLPLLHKPSFFKLLTRMYDEPAFRPTSAETVIVHMVFAIMFFQYAVRNWEDTAQQTSLNNLSNMHYHYSLSLFYQLTSSHTVQDVQALTLICSHLRNFPKPGASWMLSQTTMSLAIELGLHRSPKKGMSDGAPNALEVEIRKRTFWSILAINVSLSGKLGRPIGIKYEDFDVEIPEPVDDDLLTEAGVDTTRPGKCLHKIGLIAFQIVPLYMEMYSSIYAPRRNPETYVATVNRMESRLRAWKDSLPTELVKGESGENEQEGRVFALYVQVWAFEFRILLRHPSVSVTTDAAFNAESMRICVESSRQMLSVVRQLQKFKSLDTTWYQSAVYVMAITTTLFAQWDKRGEISPADLAALREEMNMWLDIMGDVGALLGSGTRLREAVRIVIDGTLGLLSRSLPVSKTPGYNTIEDVKPVLNPHAQDLRPNISSPPQKYPTDSTNAPPYISDPQIHQQTPYPAATQYSAYPESTPSRSMSYTPSAAYPTYPTSAPENENIDAPLLAAFAASASQLPQAHNSQSYNQPSQNPEPSSAWQQYTMTMTTNLEPHDWGSASALMQLQGGREINGEGAQGSDLGVSAGMPNNSLGGQVSGAMGMTWPLNIFDIGQGS